MPSFVFRTEKNNRVMLYIRRILEGLCAYCPQSSPAFHRITWSAPKRSLICGICGIAPTTTILGERAALLQRPPLILQRPPLRQGARLFYWLRLGLVLLDCPALAASYQLRFS
jgi:hypothetical protein